MLSQVADRGFATYLDPKNCVLSADLIERNLEKTSYVYTDLVTCMEYPVAELAEKYKKPLFVDATYCERISLENIRGILSRSTIFTANEIETKIITGRDDIASSIKIIGSCCRFAVCKLGDKDCIAIKDGKIFKQEAFHEFKKVDTTGAGDLFNAGLIFAYLNCWEPEECLKLASVTGGLAVSFYGGVDDAFCYDHVMRLYEKYTKKEGRTSR